MDNAKKAETRQRFRGHPVPLTATIVGVEYAILDADNEVTNIVFDDEDVVDTVNRIAALEAALWDLACLYSEATEDEEDFEANDKRCNDILDRFPGLAERVNGNLADAEQETD